MRTARRFIAAMLGVLWLMPSLAVCVLGLHLVLEHHALKDHHHASEHHASEHHASEPHDAQGRHDARHEHTASGHAPASTMAEVIFHGHHHEEADAADHSHQVIFSTAKLPQRAGTGIVAVASYSSSPSVASPASAGSLPDVRHRSERASPPLFTAHCSLLI